MSTTSPHIENKASLDFIMDYEMGLIDSEAAIIAGFQRLIDDGLAWSLQGHYGRTASLLIEQGLCTKPKSN